MKINKNCPCHEQCELENVRVGDFWGYECPRGLKTGKDRKFSECDTYQTWERDNAVPDDSGAAR